MSLHNFSSLTILGVCLCMALYLLELCRYIETELTLSVTIVQVIIGSEDLKANHAIKQYVDIVPEKQKYDKWDMIYIIFNP